MTRRQHILAGDPQAIEKLNARLDEHLAKQEAMKAVNVHYRKTGTCVGAPGLSAKEAARLETAMARAYERQPFSEYTLIYNYREITRLRNRVAEITKYREMESGGWMFSGGHAVVDTEQGQLRLHFDQAPDVYTLDRLKYSGFRKSAAENTWYRQLNDNAMQTAKQAYFLHPLKDKETSGHKQKSSPYADMAR